MIENEYLRQRVRRYRLVLDRWCGPVYGPRRRLRAFILFLWKKAVELIHYRRGAAIPLKLDWATLRVAVNEISNTGLHKRGSKLRVAQKLWIVSSDPLQQSVSRANVSR